MTPEEIILYLNEEFPTMVFDYKKKEHKTRNLYEFSFNGDLTGSVLFDFNMCPDGDERCEIVKKSIIAHHKCLEKEDVLEDEEGSKLKKLWKK
jgi:hypothetical protein